MANTQNRRTPNRSKTTNTRTNSNKKTNRKRSDEDLLVMNYIVLISSLVICVLLFLCNFGLVGSFGEIVSKIMGAIFGKMAYVFPVFLIIISFLWISKQQDNKLITKIVAFFIIFFSVSVIFEICNGYSVDGIKYDIKAIALKGFEEKNGGGIFAGSLGYFLKHYIDRFATILICVVLLIISAFLLFGKTIVDVFINGSDRFREMNEYRQEQMELKYERRENEKKVPAYVVKPRGGQEEKERKRLEREEALRKKKLEQEAKEADNILRMDKKVAGVSSDTSLKDNNKSNKRDDMHEIIIDETKEVKQEKEIVKDNVTNLSKINFHLADEKNINTDSTDHIDNINNIDDTSQKDEKEISFIEKPKKESLAEKTTIKRADNIDTQTNNDKPTTKLVNKQYKFPPLSLLTKGDGKGNGSSRDELSETARKLEDALLSFGVEARVTDISQGPSVTRFELEPAVGVKVSKITALADDLKLHLAAKDIRIEAPIPGKSAVGIEVPNTVTSGVTLRELLEDSGFKNFSGNIVFPVGKDVAGKVVIGDIAKMPHMLIAGTTGSGKSVCINIIIMSILYKHDPKDVQLILVDPKMVELNIYNGIPHLMIPVVSDPKKAAGALHWAVAEMTDRYKKFADKNVRDLKGYNKVCEENEHLPQIVIVVDELADLMMVAAKEVEEAICRLAQLARACGIHLILATQRPSVDVITGLIKANMPSRVSFALNSIVDSRTILDMAGAEKLLGRGDMLFYPQSYTKPERLQGAFVSDEEVASVVDFVKNQKLNNNFGDKVKESIENTNNSSSGTMSSSDGGSDNDDLLVQAGYFIIDANKASIGNLQRKFKIGFNRAARIMDQLCDIGVVGDEQGTKPREILMSREQFENYVDEYL